MDARGQHAAVSTTRWPRSDRACATLTGAASRRPPRPPAAGGAGPRRSTGSAAGLVGGARSAWCRGDSVRVRGRQILRPALVFASGVYHEGRTQHDQRVRARVGRTAVTPVAGAARGAVIVVDHRRQAADARQSLQGLDARGRGRRGVCAGAGPRSHSTRGTRSCHRRMARARRRSCGSADRPTEVSRGLDAGRLGRIWHSWPGSP